jgi:hypothetical protein
LSFLRQSVSQGFMSEAQTSLLQVGSDALPLLHRLGELAVLATGTDDYRRI